MLRAIIKAAPIEMFIIGGAAVAAMLISNSSGIIKGAMGGLGKVFKGSKYKKEDYLAVIFLVSKILKTLKAEGAVALEAHIENPEASAIFGEYPKLLKDHALIAMIADTISLLVTSNQPPKPEAVEDYLNVAIKAHHTAALKPAEAMAALTSLA